MTPSCAPVRRTFLAWAFVMLIVVVEPAGAQVPRAIEAPNSPQPSERTRSGQEPGGDKRSAAADKLPIDYREQIVRQELHKHPDFRDLVISYSDPVRVQIHSAPGTATAKEMTAVVYNYSPHSPDGSMYLMMVQGAALFDGSAFARVINLDDPTLEWVEGQPQPHSDTAAGRKYEVEHRFSRANQLHDPVAGPVERRQIRRDLWLHYNPAIVEMRVPEEKATRLRELLAAREEAPFEAQFAALQRGVDPFSGAMGHAVAAAKDVAEHNLQAFFGQAQLDRLEYLSAAIAYEGSIRQEEGLDLEDSGIPLSPAQMLALAEIHEDVLDPKRNPDFQQSRQYHDPATGLSGLNQTILDRSAEVLTADQREVVRSFLVDRTMFEPSPPTPPGRDSSWLLHQPLYGPVYRRQIRRWVMRDYLAAVSDLGLSKATTDATKDLLVKRNLAPREAAYEADETGLDQQSRRVALQRATEAVVRQLKALVGEANYERLEGLKLFERIKGIVERGEAAELELAGCPLTPEQLRGVEEAFWETHTIANPQYETLRSMAPEAGTGLTAPDLAFLERTAKILSDRQQQVVRTYRMDEAAVMRRIEASQVQR